MQIIIYTLNFNTIYYYSNTLIALLITYIVYNIVIWIENICSIKAIYGRDYRLMCKI